MSGGRVIEERPLVWSPGDVENPIGFLAVTLAGALVEIADALREVAESLNGLTSEIGALTNARTPVNVRIADTIWHRQDS